jgi:hypothetical protein
MLSATDRIEPIAEQTSPTSIGRQWTIERCNQTGPTSSRPRGHAAPHSLHGPGPIWRCPQAGHNPRRRRTSRRRPWAAAATPQAMRAQKATLATKLAPSGTSGRRTGPFRGGNPSPDIVMGSAMPSHRVGGGSGIVRPENVCWTRTAKHDQGNPVATTVVSSISVPPCSTISGGVVNPLQAGTSSTHSVTGSTQPEIGGDRDHTTKHQRTANRDPLQ